ncbi:MAG TPA: ribosome assembly RNA-binding protein YhbY [Myxococcales bacterium]|nr:ribosome assembly RNA-binding protein YhbY [Myxococcales bacterium]
MTGKQRRYLRALGHALKPVIQVGQDGVSDALVKAADEQLEAHELIKVKILEPNDRSECAGQLAQKSGAELAQVLGRTALLYRARKEKPAIVLP